MKEFLPDLWVTMHDAASREAATAARKAFDVAFPAEQGVEALTRCSQVILKSIQSNLNATPESILELAKAFVSDAASEAEDCYDRTVESSLIALSRFIHLLPTEENEKLCQESEQEGTGRKGNRILAQYPFPLTVISLQLSPSLPFTLPFTIFVPVLLAL